MDQPLERGGTQSKPHANGRVKIAKDSEGNKYAMKIMNKEDAENQEEFDLSLFLTLMNNEVGKLKDLPPHPNVINLIEYNWNGIYKKPPNTDKDILYVVLELAEGGDLFDYIFTVGKGFSR